MRIFFYKIKQLNLLMYRQSPQLNRHHYLPWYRLSHNFQINTLYLQAYSFEIILHNLFIFSRIKIIKPQKYCYMFRNASDFVLIKLRLSPAYLKSANGSNIIFHPRFISWSHLNLDRPSYPLQKKKNKLFCQKYQFCNCYPVNS